MRIEIPCENEPKILRLRGGSFFPCNFPPMDYPNSPMMSVCSGFLNYQNCMPHIPYQCPNIPNQPFNIPYPPLNISYQPPNVPYPPLNIPYPPLNISYQPPNIPYPPLNIPYQCFPALMYKSSLDNGSGPIIIVPVPNFSQIQNGPLQFTEIQQNAPLQIHEISYNKPLQGNEIQQNLPVQIDESRPQKDFSFRPPCASSFVQLKPETPKGLLYGFEGKHKEREEMPLDNFKSSLIRSKEEKK